MSGADLLAGHGQATRRCFDHVGVQQVQRADERRHEPRRREVVDVGRSADLLDPAFAHHDDPVRQRERLLLVVRHIDGGDAELALDRPDLVAQRDADLGVERRQGLVEEQYLRFDGQRAGQRDALLLSTRQLPREAVAATTEMDELEQLADARRDLGLRSTAHLHAEADVVGHGHVGEQRI